MLHSNHPQLSCASPSLLFVAHATMGKLFREEHIQKKVEAMLTEAKMKMGKGDKKGEKGWTYRDGRVVPGLRKRRA